MNRQASRRFAADWRMHECGLSARSRHRSSVMIASLMVLLFASASVLAQQPAMAVNQPSATQAPAAQTPATTTPSAAPAASAPDASQVDAKKVDSSKAEPPKASQPKKDKLPIDDSFNDVHVAPVKPEPTKDPAASAIPPGGAVPSAAALKAGFKTMHVDVNLVLVPVTITDPMNRLVTGLERENFVVMDNGEKQEIRHFSSEDAPVSLGVIFDMSGSMSDKIDRSKEAVVEFFKTANPDDEFFLVVFNDKPEMISDFTNSVEQIQGQLVYALPKGRTALMDAIYMGLAKMRQAKNQKKALLIISDGGDNHSRYTESEIQSMVKEADVQLYAIGIFSPNPSTLEEQTGPVTLSSITDVTGGRTFTVDNVNELADIATKIGVELRNQYVLGYRPTKPARDGKWRKIKVKLLPPKGLPPLSVYAKTGYYAPNE